MPSVGDQRLWSSAVVAGDSGNWCDCDRLGTLESRIAVLSRGWLVFWPLESGEVFNDDARRHEIHGLR